MKIIAVGMNYAAHNKELHHSLELSEPTIFMKSDSSLLKDGKPFFIPDFSSEVHYETEIVVRIDRLGKNIAERFAHRYYNEVTVGIDFTARDLQNKLRAQGLPWEISKAFDNSAVIGTFIPLEQAGDVNRLPFHLDINGSKVQEGITNMGGSMRLGAYDCTLKEGSKVLEAYGKEHIQERHRHRFEFNNEYKKQYEAAGMMCTGENPETNLVEVVEIPALKWFVGVQYHPEYNSTVVNPNPLFLSFVKAAIENKK